MHHRGTEIDHLSIGFAVESYLDMQALGPRHDHVDAIHLAEGLEEELDLLIEELHAIVALVLGFARGFLGRNEPTFGEPDSTPEPAQHLISPGGAQMPALGNLIEPERLGMPRPHVRG